MHTGSFQCLSLISSRSYLSGSIVTIDAMGTQKSIAKVIIDNQTNYILALKGNQTYLKEDVENLCKQMNQKLLINIYACIGALKIVLNLLKQEDSWHLAGISFT